MSELPAPIRDYLRTLQPADQRRAYLLLDSDGKVSSSGGDWPAFGVDQVRRGAAAQSQISFLEGLLPLPDPPLLLSALEVVPGVHADAHLFKEGDRTWVFLEEVSDKVRERRTVQQLRNELALMREFQGPQSDASLLARLVTRSGDIVLKRLEPTSFRVLGLVPDWFADLIPEIESGPVDPTQAFPVLENFLEDADPIWSGASEGKLESGAWAEQDREGDEIHLEASAFRVGESRLLKIRRMGSHFQERRSLLQKARENFLAHQRLLEEIEHKEILLHCIVHDLGGPITGIRGCFFLLNKEEMSAAGRRRVELGVETCDRLDRLVKDVLDVFTEKIRWLGEAPLEEAPDVLDCAQSVMDSLSSAAKLSEVGLRLALESGAGRNWKVFAERSRLERVLFNLIENSLRHSPRSSQVTIVLRHEGDQCLVAIDDEGPGVPDRLSKTIFTRFVRGSKAGRAGLGLFFCRMMIDRWGGSIGHENRATGGARFWFRLPVGS